MHDVVVIIVIVVTRIAVIGKYESSSNVIVNFVDNDVAIDDEDCYCDCLDPLSSC